MIGMGYREACGEVVNRLKKIFPKDRVYLYESDWGDSGYIIALDGRGVRDTELISFRMNLNSMSFWQYESDEDWINDNVNAIQKRWRKR